MAGLAAVRRPQASKEAFMIPMRFVRPMAVLAILVGACSSQNGSAGNGGAQGNGAVLGQGGASASGGVASQGAGGMTGGHSMAASGGIATGGQSAALSTGVGGAGAAGTTGGSAGLAATGTGAGGNVASGGTGGSGGGPGSGSGGATGGATSPALGGMAGSGSGGSSNSGVDGGVARSTGCGTTSTLQNGQIKISYGGAQRDYVLRLPDSYDNTQPYRLVFAYAWDGASSSDVAGSSCNYFTFPTMDSKNTIFVAPDAAGGNGQWSASDVEFTDAILTQVEDALCVDKTRIFATGFSFGGAMSLALACTRANVFRAVAFFSGADLTGACASSPPTTPIPYYASQASQDSASITGSEKSIEGEVYQATFATINGCTAVPSSTTFPSSGQPHTCTIYQGCSAGHPTEYCVFNGPHGWQPVDPGQTTSWDAPEAWKFITQF